MRHSLCLSATFFIAWHCIKLSHSHLLYSLHGIGTVVLLVHPESHRVVTAIKHTGEEIDLYRVFLPRLFVSEWFQLSQHWWSVKSMLQEHGFQFFAVIILLPPAELYTEVDVRVTKTAISGDEILVFNNILYSHSHHLYRQSNEPWSRRYGTDSDENMSNISVMIFHL